MEVRAKGTRRRPCWEERSDRERTALGRGQQSSRTCRQQNKTYFNQTRLDWIRLKILQTCLSEELFDQKLGPTMMKVPVLCRVTDVGAVDRQRQCLCLVDPTMHRQADR